MSGLRATGSLIVNHAPSFLAKETGRGWRVLAVLALIILAAFWGAENIHAAAVCPPDQTLTDGDHVACTKSDATHISLNLSGVDIDTTADQTPAVSASHTGTGNVTVDVSSQSELTTTGVGSHGISAVHTGSSGNVNIRVNGSTIEAGVEGEVKSAYAINAVRGAGVDSQGDGPPPGNHVGDLLISLSSSRITSHDSTSANAVHARHSGEGKFDITLGSSTIATTGTNARAVIGEHLGQCPAGSGSSCYARIRSMNGVSIMAPGANSTGIRLTRTQRTEQGVFQPHLPTEGAIEVSGNTITAGGFGVFNSTEEVRPGNVRTRITDTTITVSEDRGVGVFSSRSDSGEQAITLVCTGSPAAPCEITTQGARGYGVWGYHETGSSGDVRIDVQGDYSITTESTAKISDTTFSNGIYGRHSGSGSIHIDAQGSITTAGVASNGIYGRHHGTGDIRINQKRGHSITTKSTSGRSETDPLTLAHGIRGYHQGTGDVHINAQGSITTAGTNSYGIYSQRWSTAGPGNINLTTGGSSRITTTGPSGHGIVAYHYNLQDTRITDITVGGSIDVTGTGAQGVRVGALSDGAPIRVAARGADGFLQQTVRVNDAITSAAEGVYLAGGGRVIIGPRGSIDSDAGIAVLATGTVPEDSTDMDNVVPAIPPRLRVDLNPGGRRIAQVLNGGWILNDGGETTVAVNGTVLHEGATGVVSNAVARNGAWNVTMRAEGVNVSDYSSGDPMSWTKTEPAAGLVPGRDFSSDDFTEVRRPTPPPPPPPMCAEGQTGTPPDCMDPEPEPSPSDPDPEPSGPMIIEDYAPRAALYEALPEFLLGLHTTAQPGPALHAPDLPLWLEVSGYSGEHDPQDSTTGAQYDTAHRVAALGGTLVHNEHWNVQASVHRVSGSAGVSSAVRAGEIEARGRGLSLKARWTGGGPYLHGRVAWTDYELDLDSDDPAVNRLVSSLGAERLALQLEAGHRLPWGTRSFLTPQVGLAHTQVEIDRFTDTVGARAAFRDAERSSARLGIRADTVQGVSATGVALYASVHLEHHLETATTADVSGERLRAHTRDRDLLLALGAGWQHGPWTLQAGLGARHALDNDSHEYSGNIRVGVPF